MDVKFYPRTVDYRSATSAKILYKGSTIGYEKKTFTRVSEDGAKVPIFSDRNTTENSIAMKMAQRLLEEKEAKVMLVCKPHYFKDFIKNSQANLMAHLKYDDQEKVLIYYVAIVDEISILLIAYEEWD